MTPRRTPAELAGDAHDLMVAAEVASRAGLADAAVRYRAEAKWTLQQVLALMDEAETLAERPR